MLKRVGNISDGDKARTTEVQDSRFKKDSFVQPRNRPKREAALHDEDKRGTRDYQSS